MPSSLDAYRRIFDLTGRTALVLGAASGIGKASAEALAAMGAVVVCADRDGAGAAATAAGIRAQGGAGAEAHETDAADGAAVEALVARSRSGRGRIDVALTTPAINIRKRLLDTTDAEFGRVLDLNLKGTFLFLRAVGRVMEAQGYGSLIACSSMRAMTLEPGLAVYASTKAGIVQLVRGLAAELGPAGVRVNAIVPSIVETALTEPLKQRPDIHAKYAAHTALGRWSQPGEVAG
ncbi:MAG: SDR family oxidoreductase, partial [Alphaproteobacteria bacterium]|nr:SDR family oxidoreductase [Alphaproteobacteria bacterium]